MEQEWNEPFQGFWITNENRGEILSNGFTFVSDEFCHSMNKIRLKCLGVQPNYETFKKKEGTYFRIFDFIIILEFLLEPRPYFPFAENVFLSNYLHLQTSNTDHK